jgi:RNA polymerase sigma-70 factor (ECF subfamily)
VTDLSPDASSLEAPTPPVDGDREAVLAARALVGDGDAFGALVAPHLARAFRLAQRILGNREDTEDLVQEAALRAYDRLSQFDRTRPFAPWFLRVVWNLALRRRDAVVRRRHEPLDDGMAADPAAASGAVDRDEFWAEFRRAVASLPPRQRAIVMLFDVDGYSGAEIAAQLDITPETVRWHLHQARKTLRPSMERFRDAFLEDETT